MSGGLDANRTPQATPHLDGRGTRATRVAGPSGAQSALAGSTRSGGIDLCRGTRQSGSRQEVALLIGDGRQVAVSLSASSTGRALRRTATRSTSQGQRGSSGKGRDSDFGKHAPWSNP